MEDGTILLTGANGQIGTELTVQLQEIYGFERVIATDIKQPAEEISRFEILNILDGDALDQFINRHKVKQVYHLAALLSSKGEENPSFTWQLNFDAYIRLLQIAHSRGVEKIFFPSTIGIYGPTTPKTNTPQNASFIPSTVYGISKFSGELWSEYYFRRYGLDIRGLRYPGVISHKVRPHGGTTDFAVEIFFDAREKSEYNCYLKADTKLPMMYMPDVMKATIDLMETDRTRLSTSMAYNIHGFSLSPKELASEIQKYLPDFRITYEPDHRQKIADSWTESIDDSLARADWAWNASFDMSTMVKDMIDKMMPKN